MENRFLKIVILLAVFAVTVPFAAAQTPNQYKGRIHRFGGIKNTRIKRTVKRTNRMRKTVKKQSGAGGISVSSSTKKQADSGKIAGVGDFYERPKAKKTRIDSVAERFLLQMRRGRINHKTSTAQSIRIGSELLSAYMLPK